MIAGQVASRPIRTYADASVFGGAFDAEFSDESLIFFGQVKSGRFALVVSNVVERELIPAPPAVRMLYAEMLRIADIAEIDLHALQLQEAYLAAGIITRNWEDDALHVAVATVSGCDMIVSWNFKHIVHFQKMPLYNAINQAHGYRSIGIYSPSQVIYENEDV